MFLLIDCNQFFVSCEQLFNPKLRGQPVVVLSCNDGCVVSRSKEAKALGIPMGAPAFKYKDLFERRGVHIFSSNFALYADMSRRVMETLHSLSPDVEEYSVDEAFLLGKREDAPLIQAKILKWTGIPVSIGIGPTKTLAKVANDLAKKSASGILELSDPQMIDAHLEKLRASEIWGIGSRTEANLRREKIFTALQLKNADSAWIQKQFSVVLLRTALELRGIPALTLEEIPETRKSLTYSRSFGERITELSDLEEAASTFVSRGGEKLRREELLASSLTVYITTSPFLQAPHYYANALTVSLPAPTSYTPLLISKAKEALFKIYRPGFLYKKAGIHLGEISSSKVVQGDLFSPPKKEGDKQRRAMKLLDQVNEMYGKGEMGFAAEGVTPKWKGLKDHTSSRYTTRWSGLLEIQI